MRTAIIVLLGASLAACSSPRQSDIRRQIIDRALAGAPGQAQPSKIVAREIAFARMAREQGQWTAFSAFAAPGALLHGRDGPVDAKQWLTGRANPAQAVQWDPRSVWMSCDGAMAVSQGRFREPGGTVGNYVTVWALQRGGEFAWTYDIGWPDDPQPPPRKEFEDGDIVVTSLDAVKADIADCPRRGEAVPPAPAFSIAGDFAEGRADGGQVSGDGTLRWRWEQHGSGARRVVVDYFLRGGWQNALDETLPPLPP